MSTSSRWPLLIDASLKKKGSINLNFSFGPGVKDVQNFTSQLAVMIRAGISIRAAIEGIADQVENPKFKKMLAQMKKDVEGGKQFSDALMRYPKIFSPLYINMVKASELSGGFSKMLDKHRRLSRAADRNHAAWSSAR